MVDVSALNHVLSVDTTKRLAVVEPNVPMDKLVRTTLKKGLLPPVVMEFPGITVGGAIQGNGGESSSFKYGTFNQTAISHEIITGDGNVYQTSNKKHSDLFYGVPGTAGTLGVLTAATIKLIPAKKFVNVEYLPVESFDNAKLTIARASADKKNDFIDGIMFSASSGVIIVGRLSNAPSKTQVRFTRARDEVYYLHVEQQLAQNSNGWHESIPLKDYLFRYDRGAFWVGRFAFRIFNIPYNRFMRWLLTPLLRTRKLYQALQESGQSQHHIVQDLVLPSDKFVEFCQFVDQELSVYPLWLCPMLVDEKATFQLNNLPTKSIINVGVWGSEIADHAKFVRKNRQIETEILKLGGKKWSYAYSYFTQKEFWRMYDKPKYDALRQKYGATYLPTIHDKLTVKDYYEVKRKKAALKTLFGLARLKIR